MKAEYSQRKGGGYDVRLIHSPRVLAALSAASKQPGGVRAWLKTLRRAP